jgi:hypothetical protein
MRIGALLFVGLGLLLVGACSADTSENLVCQSAGGVCIALDGGLAGCGEMQNGYPCDDGFICCTPSQGTTTTTTTTTGDAGGTPAAADGH